MKRKYLAMLVVSIFILSILITVIIENINKENLKNTDHDSPENEERINSTIYKIQKIDNLSDYYTIKSIVGKYYLYYSKIFDGEGNEISLDYDERLYNMLSPLYLNKYNIKIDNIKEYLQEKRDFSVEIYNSYYTTNYTNSIYYFVSGLLRNNSNYETEEFQIMLSLDNVNGTFEIFPQEYIKEELNIDVDSLNVNDEISLNYDTSISNRNDNTFSIQNVSYEEYAKAMFDRIRLILLYDVNKAYELLSKEKISEFSSQIEMSEYLLQNRKKIYLLTFGGYKLRFDNNKLIFDCYDKNSEYNITMYTDSIMDFKYTFNEI